MNIVYTQEIQETCGEIYVAQLNKILNIDAK